MMGPCSSLVSLWLLLTSVPRALHLPPGRAAPALVLGHLDRQQASHCCSVRAIKCDAWGPPRELPAALFMNLVFG